MNFNPKSAAFRLLYTSIVSILLITSASTKLLGADVNTRTPTMPLIKHYNKGNSGLPTNVVYRITSDPYRYLWLATNAGIYIFNGQDFQKFETPTVDIEFVSAVRIDSLWFCFTYSGEIISINLVNRHVSLLKNKGPAVYNLTNPKINAFKIPGSNTIIAMDTHGGYFELLVNKYGIYEYYQAFLNGSLKIRDLYPGITTFPSNISDSMLYIIPRISKNFYRIDNSFLIMGNTLYSFTKEGNSKMGVKNLIDFRDQKDFNDLLVDFATTKEFLIAGFHKSNGLVTFKNNKEIKDLNDGYRILNGVSVTDIDKVDDEMIWVSSIDEGIYLLDFSIKRIDDNINVNINFKDVTMIKQISDTLFIGLKDGTLVTSCKGKTTTLHIETLFSHNEIYGLFPLGTNKHFIVAKDLITLTKGSKILFSKKNLFVKDCIENDTNIYLCHKTAYSVINKHSLKITTYIRNTEVMVSIAQSKDGSLYFGSVNKLFKEDREVDIGQEVRIYKIRSFGRFILAGTDRGLFVIQPDEKVIHLQERMKHCGTLIKKLFPYNDQELYVLTEKGLFYTDTNWAFTPVLTYSPNKPISNITDVTFDNSNLIISSNSGIYTFKRDLISIAKKGKTPFQRIILNGNYHLSPYTRHHNTTFNKNTTYSFNFETVDYFNIQNDIIWTLKERSGKKIKSDTLPSDKSFLPVINKPGRYIIEGKAMYSLIDFPKPITFQLNIEPKFWQLTWFVLLIYILAIFSIMYFSVSAYILYNKRHLDKIKLQNYMNQLRNKVQISRLKPHFIFNSFNPIQSHILKNNSLEALEYIESFSKLLRHLINLFAKDFISLSEEIIFIDEYIVVEKSKNEGRLKFLWKIDMGENLDLIYVPTMMLQPFIENSLKYGRSLGASLKVEVAIYYEIEGNKLLITISDNGPGFPNHFTLKPGHALDITEKRLELLRMEYGVGSARYSNDNGATVFLELPYIITKPQPLD